MNTESLAALAEKKLEMCTGALRDFRATHLALFKKMGIKLPKNRSEALDLYLELAQKGYFNKKEKYDDMALAEIGGIMISSLEPKPSEKFKSLS